MIYTIDEIKKRISPVVQKYRIPKIYLFGSYARNEATQDSDMDFVIDSTPLHGLLQLQAFCDDLQDAVCCSVDVLTLQALEEERDNPLKKNFLESLAKERILLS